MLPPPSGWVAPGAGSGAGSFCREWMGAGWHCRRLLGLLAQGAGATSPPDGPRKAGGQMEPRFAQPDSAPSSSGPEGATPADSAEQVGSRGEHSPRRSAKAASLCTASRSSAWGASEGGEPEFQKANREARFWFLSLRFPLPFSSRGLIRDLQSPALASVSSSVGWEEPVQTAGSD